MFFDQPRPPDKGNMIHYSAKATNNAYMPEFDGLTTIRKASLKAYGFVRYPFQLQDSDVNKLSDNKYLIDVAGYVTNVKRTNHLKSGSKNLDFHLANHRVTLWGSLGDVLIEKKPNRLVCASYLQPVPRNKVYLSSTSSTVIYDDDAIPAIKALKQEHEGEERFSNDVPQHDIAIVGGGMVGMALASSLASMPLIKHLSIAIIDSNRALLDGPAIKKDDPQDPRDYTGFEYTRYNARDADKDVLGCVVENKVLHKSLLSSLHDKDFKKTIYSTRLSSVIYRFEMVSLPRTRLRSGRIRPLERARLQEL
nr:ubiquinone biosynthesis monooxygenase COQ6, mitochondrial [Tanacetum cinerariifolium]